MVKFKILMIGPLPPPIGGTTVSFQYLINELRDKENIIIDTINTSNYKNWSKYRKLIIHLYKSIEGSQVVSLHVSSSSLPFIGIVILLICKYFNKPLIIRKFGGTDLNTLQYFKRKLGWLALKQSNLYLAQTKELVKSSIDNGIKHVEWYPTNRPDNLIGNKKNEYNNKYKRFVYIGAIRSEKGINEIINAGEKFDGDNVKIDLYGNADYDIEPENLCDLKNVNYKGKYNPETVYNLIQDYDVLLLPSYYYGEGYPGVVIEALRTGIPVICTKWKALPELIDNTCGVLIEPKSSQSLYNAMNTIINNEEYYLKLSVGAKERGDLFSSKYWADQFVKHCRSLIEEKNI